MTGRQSAIIHCEGCGCDWVDNGLNPVGCPYCKLSAETEALRAAIERLVEIADRDPFQTIGFIVEHVVDLRTTITDGEASNGS